MSKKSKSRQKELRKSKKRARKLANRALYEERKRQGINTKSSRARRNSKRSKRKLKSHPFGPCGNIGCKRCDPKSIHKQRKKYIKIGNTKYEVTSHTKKLLTDTLALYSYQKRVNQLGSKQKV